MKPSPLRQAQGTAPVPTIPIGSPTSSPAYFFGVAGVLACERWRTGTSALPQAAIAGVLACLISESQASSPVNVGGRGRPLSDTQKPNPSPKDEGNYEEGVAIWNSTN
ncbi:MAG: hypothetical protein N3D16_07935 [Anaerolineales bacterium]|nr:hypothetical protein [Anaerolineales bacterium]